jgi:hypothetical protein
MAGYVIAAETCYLLPVIRVTRSTKLKTIDCLTGAKVSAVASLGNPGIRLFFLWARFSNTG